MNVKVKQTNFPNFPFNKMYAAILNNYEMRKTYGDYIRRHLR